LNYTRMRSPFYPQRGSKERQIGSCGDHRSTTKPTKGTKEVQEISLAKTQRAPREICMAGHVFPGMIKGGRRPRGALYDDRLSLRPLRLGERLNFAFDPFHFVPFVGFVVQTPLHEPTRQRVSCIAHLP